MAETPQCWKDAETAITAGIPTILHGPPGTGKTFAGLRFGESVEHGAFRISCTADMTEMDITGGWMPDGANTWSWREGQAIRAWEGDGFRGGRLVIDEIDRATGDVLSAILLVTDSNESAKWEHPEQKRIMRPRDGFTAVLTTNLEDLNLLDAALLDRFPARIRINTPHPGALETLPYQYRNYAARMADAGKDRITIRQFQAIVGLRNQGIPESEAVRLILGADRRDAFMEAVQVDRIEEEVA